MTTTGWATVIIVVLIILGAGWWWYSSQTPALTPSTQTSTLGNPTAGPAQGENGPGTTSAAPVTVTYTASGFSPASVTVPVGTTVTFVDGSANPLWVASNPHPVHTAYDGTSSQQHCAPGYSGPAPLDECTTITQGQSWSFTFTKAGTFGYHNHALHSDTGTVIVQ